MIMVILTNKITKYYLLAIEGPISIYWAALWKPRQGNGSVSLPNSSMVEIQRYRKRRRERESVFFHG